MRIIEKAAALTAAPNKNNQHNKDYRTSDGQSSKKLKEQLGVLLLYLQTPLSRQQKNRCWQYTNAVSLNDCIL